MSLKQKLQRLKVHMTSEPAATVVAVPDAVPAADVEIPFADKWEALQAQPFTWDDEYVMVREVRYPARQRHGQYQFAELYDAVEAWEASGRAHPLSVSGRAPGDLLFFDTETTGLHGGVGNTIFLLGYSRLEDDCVVVRQHFLASPHAEVALYQSFLLSVRETHQLVTYNGKAFDWPQVRTRHTLNRASLPPLPSFGHCDLLHAARRLWKDELASCRLSIVEREKLGVRRDGDLPGHMAPIAYFDYLRQRDPEAVTGVLRHNESDVLSLIVLYIHLTRLLLEHEQTELTHEERFQIARWYEALGDDDAAMRRYRSIAASDHPLRVKARIALGHLYKRQKQWEHALEMWEAVISAEAQVPEEVYLEAAKICEHHLKDYEKALHYTLQAFERWKKKTSLLRRASKAERQAYEKRIERLERKGDRLF